jgi:hypothetical protein
MIAGFAGRLNWVKVPLDWSIVVGSNQIDRWQSNRLTVVKKVKGRRSIEKLKS